MSSCVSLLSMIKLIPCDACGGTRFQRLFEKASSRGEMFSLVRCLDCGLVQVNPQPDLESVRPYYEEEYFKKRSDRGYDNYYSSDVKNEIRRVYSLNLRDLGFFEFEAGILKEGKEKPDALDAGCAAGYFVEYLKDRGWKSEGIEISRSAASFGIEKLGLDIRIGDFLSEKDLAPSSYDLITLWASLEHMHSPRAVLARASELLKPGGCMILSTCRYGHLAKWNGPGWRYMNVPEHLYFFSLRGLKQLAAQCGLNTVSWITYGSGMTSKKGASIFYRALKKLADPGVKIFGQGDMMALRFQKM